MDAGRCGHPVDTLVSNTAATIATNVALRNVSIT